MPIIICGKRRQQPHEEQHQEHEEEELLLQSQLLNFNNGKGFRGGSKSVKGCDKVKVVKGAAAAVAA